MQQGEHITELSFRGVYSLLEELKKGVIVQILEPEVLTNPREFMKSKKYRYIETRHCLVL